MDSDAVFQAAYGGDVVAAEGFGGVAFIDDFAQVVFGDVGGEQADHFKRQIGIAQAAPALEHGFANGGVFFGHHQAAVGRKPHKQDFAKGFGRGLAAGADVFHGGVSWGIGKMLETAGF